MSKPPEQDQGQKTPDADTAHGALPAGSQGNRSTAINAAKALCKAILFADLVEQSCVLMDRKPLAGAVFWVIS